MRKLKLKLNPKREALLAERAHAMRHAPTRSEAVLWRLLSGGKLGVAFRRQVPLGGRYVADFLAPSVWRGCARRSRSANTSHISANRGLKSGAEGDRTPDLI